jgi:hypothetical protein
MEKVLIFLDKLKRLLGKIKNFKLELSFKRKVDTYTATLETDGSSLKIFFKMTQKSADIGLYIGFMVNDATKSSPTLFLSIPLPEELLKGLYIGSLPHCISQHAEYEELFVLEDTFNTEFFDEKTPDERREKILADIFDGLNAKIEECVKDN